jgi:hypothetical protein
MRYEFCEGCIYDHENADGGCDMFLERRFMCEAHTDKARKAELDLLEKAYANSKSIYVVLSASGGKYCVES